jgi:hypothetical protein
MRPEEETPIYLKAKEIQQLVESLVTLVKESDLPYADEVDLELINDKLSEMQLNAVEIPSLISSASHPNSPYDYNMENAVFIKKACHDLLGGAVYIEDMGLKDIDYLDLLYDAIDAFRLLFIEWIKTFELWKYDGEDWGIFNPEGIKIVYMNQDEDEDDDYEDEDDDIDNKY